MELYLLPYGVILIIYGLAALEDIQKRTISNWLSQLLLAFGSFMTTSLKQSIVSGLIVLSLLLLLSVGIEGLLKMIGRSGDCLGGGDIKLLSATAYIIGVYETVLVLFFSQLYALLFAAVYRLWSKRTLQSVPLAPFLLLGLVTLIFM